MGGRRRAHGVAAAAASCLELGSLAGDGPGSVSTASVCSAFSYLDGDTEDIQVDEFERRLDALFEKRGATREKALESLAVMLRVDYRADNCLSHSETLTSRCLVALKRGSAVESSLASQLLGLHILTLGQADDRLFQTLRQELERSAIGSTGGGAAVQMAAIDTLALAAFVLAEDESGTRAVMDRLRALWGKGDAKARAAAVRGWSFLLTSLDNQLRDDEATACLAALAGLMDERDLELRTAAGEAAAVLRCSCSEGILSSLAEADKEEDADEEEEEEEEEDHIHESNGSGGGGGRSKGAGGGCRAGRRLAECDNGGGRMGELVEKMQDLALNKGDKLRRSRRERASQRSTFRGLLGALSGEAVPECRIKLQHGDMLTVEGVAATHRLAFLRRFLAGGFQVGMGTVDTYVCAHVGRSWAHNVIGDTTQRPDDQVAICGS
ncbi:hypothetical protein Vafri_4505 [Volvox africanus]|uniref:Interferon-related developmental regulator N-terminal domain-containing protein n=1 Tax=Volvox africanus TaxID=51714 RepID=A0A8J4AVL6_9CHLO|nr:hypothetical protein Vafri_4505 [Volvox africanus]